MGRLHRRGTKATSKVIPLPVLLALLQDRRRIITTTKAHLLLDLEIINTPLKDSLKDKAASMASILLSNTASSSRRLSNMDNRLLNSTDNSL